MLATLLAACASNGPAPPPAATPLTSRAFVYAASGDRSGPASQTLTTYEVLAETGDLVPIASQPVTRCVALAADPRGRFLFATGGPDGDPEARYWVRSDAIDASGGLRPVSVDRQPGYCGDVVPAAGLIYVAMPNRDPTGAQHSHPSWAIYDVGESGSLTHEGSIGYEQGATSVDSYGYSWLLTRVGDPLVHIVLDDFLYDPEWWAHHRPRQVTTWRIDTEPTRVGFALLAEPVPVPITNAALVSDFVVVSDRGGTLRSVKLDDTFGRASLAGQVATGCAAERPLLAVHAKRLAIGGANAVCTVEVDDSGQLLARGQIAADKPSQLVFHPSGQFLYSAEATGLRIYAVAADGTITAFRPEPIQTGTVVAMAVAPAP